MTDLTRKQRLVLAFIREHITEVGIPPTMREIAARFEIQSTNGVVHYLDILEDKGYIRRLPNMSRGIVILEEAP